MTWESILYGSGIIIAIVLLAYIYKTQRDFLRLVLQEKVDFLGQVIPLLEGVSPYLPPNYKQVVDNATDVLKTTKQINEALLKAPIWNVHKRYVLLKARFAKK